MSRRRSTERVRQVQELRRSSASQPHGTKIETDREAIESNMEENESG